MFRDIPSNNARKYEDNNVSFFNFKICFKILKLCWLYISPIYGNVH